MTSPNLTDALTHLGNIGAITEKNKRGEFLIIAVNKNNKDFEIRVEVTHDFNEEKNGIELEFFLAVRRRVEKIRRVTVDSEKIQEALKTGTDIVGVAVVDQFEWFNANYPEIGGKIFKTYQERVVPAGKSTKPKKRL